jgi:hypothetical protein
LHAIGGLCNQGEDGGKVVKKSVFVSLLAIGLCLCWQNAAGEAGQDSTENVVQADTLLHLTAKDSTALEEIKALIKDVQYAEAETQARELLAKVEAEHGAESLEAAHVLDQLVESLWRGGEDRRLTVGPFDIWDMPLANG